MGKTNDKKLICKLLLEQFNSAFSIPLSNKVVTDPVSFFAISNACYKKSEVLLTSINFSEQMIIDAISEISASSSPGPDGIQASFWKKCAIELAVPLQMFLYNLWSLVLFQNVLRELQLFQFIRVVINHYRLITAQYLSLQS